MKWQRNYNNNNRTIQQLPTKDRIRQTAELKKVTEKKRNENYKNNNCLQWLVMTANGGTEKMRERGYNKLFRNI